VTSVHLRTLTRSESKILFPLRSWGSTAAGSRLIRLYVASRRVPVALGALVGCSLVLRGALDWRWVPSSGPLTQQLPFLLEAGTATVIAMTTYSPFGEPERATGRWLPYLRFGTAVALIGVAVGLLSAGASGAHLPGGTLDVARNVAGITGIGLISAAVIGAGLSWIGPMAYLVLSEDAILNGWRSPWIWSTRPSHDPGSALCAALVFVTGAGLITALGARQRAAK
jgi:hypothetical protein